MPSSEQDIRKALTEMAVPAESIEEAVQNIMDTKNRLAKSMDEFKGKGLLRFLAISQDKKAIQIIDDLTDCIVQRQGLLALAMQGKEIHDDLVTIKAKLYSLITGEKEEPMTVKKLKSTTQRMLQMDRMHLPEPEEED